MSRDLCMISLRVSVCNTLSVLYAGIKHEGNTLAVPSKLRNTSNKPNIFMSNYSIWANSFYSIEMILILIDMQRYKRYKASSHIIVMSTIVNSINFIPYLVITIIRKSYMALLCRNKITCWLLKMLRAYYY